VVDLWYFPSFTCGCHDFPHVRLFLNGGFKAVVNSRVLYVEYNGPYYCIDLFIYLEITQTPNDL